MINKDTTNLHFKKTPRMIKDIEVKFILSLLKNLKFKVNENQLVIDEEDGSLFFVTENNFEEKEYGEEIVNMVSIDSDGVPLDIGIWTDNYGKLYELYIWKGDGSSVKDLSVCIKNLKAAPN